ncbi:MAG: hypothetical protein R3B09_29145 [Nannocystaceae bacterium]
MRRPRLALTLLLAAACGGPGEAPGKATPPPPPSPTPAADTGEVAPEAADPAAQPDAQSPSGRLLAWLDPDAVGATWVGTRSDLDADAMATVFGVPPRAARMLRDLQNVDEGLAILFGEDAPKTWVRPEALAMLPAMARATYVLRLLEVPRAQVEAALTAAEWESSVVEGFTLWQPSGAFPWRIVFLEDALIGLVPVQEIGSGLGPLTAARDLPPSQLRTEFGKAIAANPEILLELFCQGPLLHIDLTDDVGVIRLSLRRWQRSGIDVDVLLQPMGDAVQAASELEARKAPLESDAVQALVDRIAFTAESAMVVGRLQLPAEDLGALRRRGP